MADSNRTVSKVFVVDIDVETPLESTADIDVEVDCETPVVTVVVEDVPNRESKEVSAIKSDGILSKDSKIPLNIVNLLAVQEGDRNEFVAPEFCALIVDDLSVISEPLF